MSEANDQVTPFTIAVADDVLEDLQRRLAITRWPDAEVVDDWSQGMPLSYAKELAAYWADGYDWRAREVALNRFPQITTEIDGVSIHAIHMRSPHDDAMPICITHGWPGSIVEFHKIIEPLTNPTDHGGDAADAFHVVCPSLPGYGFSAPATEVGWGIEKIGEVWTELMARLGYDRFVAQGGDWGAMVTTILGQNHGDVVDAIHLNMPIAGPDPDTMDSLTEAEQRALEALGHYDKWDSGYSKQQSTRPQTLGYGLADSPTGQMAWIVEKFWSWMDCDGHPENILTKDELLDNVMLYWVNNAATSSARLYWESFANVNLAGVDVPTGVAAFPKEILQTSERWAAKRFHNLQQWTPMPKGGHFAAFEQPELMTEDIRSFFRRFR